MDSPPLPIMTGKKKRIVRYIARTFRSTENENAASLQSRVEASCKKPPQLNNALGAEIDFAKPDGVAVQHVEPQR